VDASAAAGSQATPLTHCRNGGSACNNATSTANGSAPHADSRGLTIWNNSLLETDDGGIYKRTSPSGTGDWFSMNGNLQVTEVHDVVYDHVSHTIMAGTQDNGSPGQSSMGATTWSDIDDGDGGDVAADDTTSSTQSTRYFSYRDLGQFIRGTFNTSGTLTSYIQPALNRLGNSPVIVTKFVTPVELNHIDATRLLIAGSNDVYESLDKGDSITAVGFGRNATAMVYGGRSGGVDNLNLIWAVAGAGVFVRTSGSGAPLAVTSPGSRPLRDVAIDPTDWQKAYVIDDQSVFYTSNTGGSWTNVTGNLGSSTTDLRTIAFIPGSQSVVAVGGQNGVFQTSATSPGTWAQFSTGLSNAIVMDLDYDALDDTLVAGTMGRGVWSLSSAGGGGTAPAAPTGVVATTTSSTTVNITWTPSSGAADYHVYRGSTLNGTYTPICSSSCSPLGYSDATAITGASYLYKVRAVANNQESADSNLDLATIVAPRFSPPTAITADDIVSLRAAVRDIRTLADLPPYTFTDGDDVLANHGAVKGIHVQELRDKLQEAWTALRNNLPTLTVPNLAYANANVDPATNGGQHFRVLRSDITKLRAGVKCKP
jgi:hypothetical protein